MQLSLKKRLSIVGFCFCLLASPAFPSSGFAYKQAARHSVVQLSMGKKTHSPRKVFKMAAKGKKKENKPQFFVELASKGFGER